jgi:protein phosphatase methylesterase 1
LFPNSFSSTVSYGDVQVYLSGELEEGGLLVLLLHGGGFTGLSYALASDELLRLTSRRCLLVAPDLRGHGLTRTKNDKHLVSP